MSATAEAKPQEPSLLEKVVESILTPGSSLTASMQVVINITFVILAFILMGLVFADPENIHLKIMIGLLLGLVFSTNWFFSLILNSDFKAEVEDKAGEDKEPKKEK
eukprot:TRINITY_DN16155_c0_g1_i1.p1 TRINITY_DN16155_c0_g1~~TRINITY_DN16155_c0_g1_i1.p1  ORF type:complete len:121 (+),score=36.27 TRINITY_DN16155_c0_g1_i1:46-363(+)